MNNPSFIIVTIISTKAMEKVIRENVNGFDNIKNNKIEHCLLEGTLQRLVGETEGQWPGASLRPWE